MQQSGTVQSDGAATKQYRAARWCSSKSVQCSQVVQLLSGTGSYVGGTENTAITYFGCNAIS